MPLFGQDKHSFSLTLIPDRSLFYSGLVLYLCVDQVHSNCMYLAMSVSDAENPSSFYNATCKIFGIPMHCCIFRSEKSC